MENLIFILTASAAGTLSYHISNKFKKGPVFGSSIITLLAGIVLPLLFPETGGKLAAAAACASYAGMAATKLIPTTFEMAFISALSGIMLLIASNAYVGVGGRLGTIAALACLAWMGIRRGFKESDNICMDKLEITKIGVWE
jgi:hypothetical protein